MPQMSPMNWLGLLILFSCTGYLVLVKINFFFFSKSGKSAKRLIPVSLNFKLLI